MSKAERASEITLPPRQPQWHSLFDFLCERFPRIAPQIWAERFANGKLHWFGGEPVSMETPYRAGHRLCYYREVAAEPVINESHQILALDEHLLVACKPHGLPVTPGGDFVNECLLARLRRDTGLDDIAPLHRLDRDTAGLVLFSVNPKSRAAYSALFATAQIHKQYQAVALLPPALSQVELPWQQQIRNRLEKSEPRFLMQAVEPGEAGINAFSTLQLVQRREALGLFQLTPHTGKTHQLRLHMLAIGCPILHDPYYPLLLPKQLAPSQPLQLLAWQLNFIDPLSAQPRQFRSDRQLASWPQDNEPSSAQSVPAL